MNHGLILAARSIRGRGLFPIHGRSIGFGWIGDRAARAMVENMSHRGRVARESENKVNVSKIETRTPQGCEILRAKNVETACLLEFRVPPLLTDGRQYLPGALKSAL